MKSIYAKVLNPPSMGGFWTDISKSSEGEGDEIFRFFFRGTSATKRFARSRILRYGLSHDILSKGKEKRREIKK